jgi:membrane protease YdiL (CAAX protease family)
VGFIFKPIQDQYSGSQVTQKSMDASSSNPTPNTHRSLFARIFISPEGHRLRAFWRLAGQIALLLVCLSLFGIAVGIFSTLVPGSSPDLILLLGLLVELFAVTLSVYLARKYFDRRTFTSLGLKWDSHAVRDILFGILLAALLIALVTLIEWAGGWLTFKSFAWETQSTAQVIVGIIVVALVYIIVGWSEELLSRGYWLQNISEGLNIFWGMLISSLLFSLTHIANPNWSWLAVINLTFNGLFLAFAYLRTRQLWLPIGIHIGWNFFLGPIFGFPVSGIDSFILINQTVNGPEILTGGAFGPEAGLINLPIIALGAALVYWYTREDAQSSAHESLNER